MPKDTYELHQERMRKLLTPSPLGSLTQRLKRFRLPKTKRSI